MIDTRARSVTFSDHELMGPYLERHRTAACGGKVQRAFELSEPTRAGEERHRHTVIYECDRHCGFGVRISSLCGAGRPDEFSVSFPWEENKS